MEEWLAADPPGYGQARTWPNLRSVWAHPPLASGQIRRPRTPACLPKAGHDLWDVQQLNFSILTRQVCIGQDAVGRAEINADGVLGGFGGFGVL